MITNQMIEAGATYCRDLLAASVPFVMLTSAAATSNLWIMVIAVTCYTAALQAETGES